MKPEEDIDKESYFIKPNNTRIPVDLEHKKLDHDYKKYRLDKLLSVNFLVFIITFFVIISGFAYMKMMSESDKVMEYWQTIIPIVTTYIGYAIGKNNPSN